MPGAIKNTPSVEEDSLMMFTSPIPALPKAPSPSKDPGVASNLDETVKSFGILPTSGKVNIFEIMPTAAMKMLCDAIENLVVLTGDVPPTPSATQSGSSNLANIQAEKENVARHLRDRHHSRQNSAAYTQEVRHARQDAVACNLQDAIGDRKSMSDGKTTSSNDGTSYTDTIVSYNSSDIDPMSIANEPPTSPIYMADFTTEVSLNLQHSLIIRKFYSKTPPSISLSAYLQRIHNYCPMSTGVYLATSLFLHRLAAVERIIPITARNAHRLLLAGLRVSMKALEDQRYRHSRVAKVGGVTETELGRLEVGFCFLTSFDLRATERMLTDHAQALKDGYTVSLQDMGVSITRPVEQDRWPFLHINGNMETDTVGGPQLEQKTKQEIVDRLRVEYLVSSPP